MLESETKRHKLNETELQDRCKHLQAELRDSKALESELSRLRKQLVSAGEEVFDLKTAVQESASEYDKLEYEQRTLATERDSVVSENDALRTKNSFYYEMCRKVAEYHMRQHSLSRHDLDCATKERRTWMPCDPFVMRNNNSSSSTNGSNYVNGSD